MNSDGYPDTTMNDCPSPVPTKSKLAASTVPAMKTVNDAETTERGNVSKQCIIKRPMNAKSQ